MIDIESYGHVYKKKGINELTAIKIIIINQIKENLLNQYELSEFNNQIKLCIGEFIKEFKIMKIYSNNNNNSVKCYEYFNNTKDSFVIIMELCDTNLSKFLFDKMEKDKNYYLFKKNNEFNLSIKKDIFNNEKK